MDLIGVPFDGWGRNGHQALASTALREAGLVDALAGHAVHDLGDLRLPLFETGRGQQTGLLNEPALLAMTGQLNHGIGDSVVSGRFPVVVGGDCSLLLGVMTGLRDALGSVGLMFVDGHEDTMPLDVSEDGEAANCEVGLLLGITGRFLSGPLAAQMPALDTDALAMLGQRDVRWRRRFNLGSLSDLGVWSRPLAETAADPADAGSDAARHLIGTAGRWWSHVDLDVLDPEVFPAQGLPDFPDEPGGLDWDQLGEALTAAARIRGCIGMSMTIYDPEQDPDRAAARRIVHLIRRVTDALGDTQHGS